MKKLLIPLLAIMLSIAVLGVASAEDSSDEHMDQPKVELTEKQQKKLAKLHKGVFKKKKKLISRYVEYGVITKEKGDKIIAHMQEHLEKLEKNGYIPDCKHKHHKGSTDRGKPEDSKEREDQQQSP